MDNHLPPTMLKDADLGQICLRSSTCPRSNSFDIATSFGKTDSAAHLSIRIVKGESTGTFASSHVDATRNPAKIVTIC